MAAETTFTDFPTGMGAGVLCMRINDKGNIWAGLRTGRKHDTVAFTSSDEPRASACFDGTLIIGSCHFAVIAPARQRMVKWLREHGVQVDGADAENAA